VFRCARLSAKPRVPASPAPPRGVHTETNSLIDCVAFFNPTRKCHARMVLSGIQHWIPAQKHCGNDKKRVLLKIVGFRSSTQPPLLLGPKDQRAIRYFSQRRLRPLLVTQNASRQIEEFNKMKQWVA